jgi:hypothetical protein
VETKGIEPSPLTAFKILISKSGGAKYGAPENDSIRKHPNFADIIETSNLPKDFKEALIATVKHKEIL